MYVYEIDLLTTFILFEDFLLLLYGFWPYSQRRAIVVFMYNLFETFSIQKKWICSIKIDRNTMQMSLG